MIRSVFGHMIMRVERERNPGNLGCAWCQHQISFGVEFWMQGICVFDQIVVICGHIDCFHEQWQLGFDRALSEDAKARRHYVN